jgi:acylphosphatase
MRNNQSQYWILIRNGRVRNVFKGRKEAVKYFKKLLNQTLKDFEKQDKSDEFDYDITIPEIKIKSVEEREAYLGL